MSNYQSTGTLIDATQLLNIHDYNDSITCVAHAPSQGRRCRNRINVDKCGKAQRILQGLSRPTGDSNELLAQLLKLVDNTTCWIGTHQDQAESIAEQWDRILRREIDRLRATRGAPRASAVPPTARGTSAAVLPPSQSMTHTRRTIQFTAIEQTTSIVFGQPSIPRPVGPIGRAITPEFPSIFTSTALAPRATTNTAGPIPSRPATSRTQTVPSNPSPPHPVIATTRHTIPRPAGPVSAPVRPATAVSSSPAPQTSSQVPSLAPQPHIETPSQAHDHVDPEPTADVTCSICLEESTEPYKTPCGHTFCRECISLWFAGDSHKSCPMDRRPLAWTELVEVEDKTCSICLEDADDPCETPCGHRFCRGCIGGWFGGRLLKTCPMDRRSLFWAELTFGSGTS